MKKLGFGLMRLPEKMEEGKSKIDMGEVVQMIDRFIAEGFTYFDTAYMYHGGESEIAFREAVAKRYSRDRFTITDKLPIFDIHKKQECEEIFEDQLGKCGVDYFDYYLLHCIDKVNYKKAMEWDCFSLMERKKREGKAKKIGFSYHGDALLLEKILAAHPEVEVVQIQLNYYDWDNPVVQSRRCYEVCEKYNKEVIVMEPVKGGTLVGIPQSAKNLFKQYDEKASIASWAIRFAASQKNVIMVLSGMSDMAQVEDNCSYMKEFQPLSKTERTVIQEVVNEMYSLKTIPCTGCKYCLSSCKKNIPIPLYIALYNQNKLFGSSKHSWSFNPILDLLVESICGNDNEKWYNYANYEKERFPTANDCVGCKCCEAKCPQHIEISKAMKLIQAELK